LRKKDLGKYLIDNDQELGEPLNLVRMTNFYGNNFGIRDLSSYANVFRDIGTYHKQNADSDVIEKLSQYYLVETMVYRVFYKANTLLIVRIDSMRLSY
jgi:hypothetical protein